VSRIENEDIPIFAALAPRGYCNLLSHRNYSYTLCFTRSFIVFSRERRGSQNLVIQSDICLLSNYEKQMGNLMRVARSPQSKTCKRGETQVIKNLMLRK
jgi:hypothetical protein